MNEILDEILGNETILINDALKLLQKELLRCPLILQEEIKEDLRHALEEE